MYISIHIPDFNVEAAVRHDPVLRRKPVAVVDGKPPVLTVVSRNAPARQCGIEPGMTQFQAGQFPDAVIRRRSVLQEASAQSALLDCAAAFSPRVEDTSYGCVVFDASGLGRLFGSAEELGRKVRSCLSQSGFVSHVAAAPNPDAAVCASRGRSGVTVIEPGREAEQLEALGVEVLPLDAATSSTLQRWGVHTLGALADLPARELAERLGQHGVYLRQLACGQSSRPLKVRKPPLYFEESIELDDGITLLEPLTFMLRRLCDALFSRLRTRALAAQELRLELRRDPPHDPFVFVLRLPVPAQNPRVAMKLLLLELEAHPPGAPVIGIRLEAQPAKPRIVQEGIFTPLAPEPEKLELTLARIAAIVGRENVGAPEIQDTHARHLGFRMTAFGGAQSGPLPETGPPPRQGSALRLFRPPQPATVRMGENAPGWIAFSGVHGLIEAASGPWRTCGDWWNSRHWSREEWDVVIEDASNRKSLLTLIYRDTRTGRWYAEGVYD